MDKLSALSRFTELSYYSSHFMDLDIWEPYVRQVCARHRLHCENVTPGLPGSFPTFIIGAADYVDDRVLKPVVVKFFGPLFEGGHSFARELGLGKWLENQPLPIRSPSILAQGYLDSEWQYLVFEFIPGVSIGQVHTQLGQADLRFVARQLGDALHELHTRSADPGIDLPESLKPSIDRFVNFLHTQYKKCLSNHQAWNDLPSHLLQELPGFILPVDRLVDFSAPAHIIHADLTADHLLGNFESSRWRTSAIIDWGDAMTGNILYELVALHIEIFNGDRQLLKEFLKAYSLPAFFQQDFTRKALSMLLLHQFPTPARFYEAHRDASSLVELAERLFDVRLPVE